jgi:hypothetical protein
MDWCAQSGKCSLADEVEYLPGNTCELPGLPVAFQCADHEYTGMYGRCHHSELYRPVESAFQEYPSGAVEPGIVCLSEFDVNDRLTNLRENKAIALVRWHIFRFCGACRAIGYTR